MRKPSPTAIGAFVLGAALLLTLAVIFFGGRALLGHRLKAVSFFDGSVAGLQLGAPVTFRGVRVGEVTSMGVRVNPETLGGVIQVTMSILPDTVDTFEGEISGPEGGLVESLVARGLSAKLVQQSFVTGQLMVELDLRPDAEPKHVGVSTVAPEIPTVQSDLEALTQRLADVRLEDTMQSVQRALDSINQLLSAPELQQSIQELPALIAQLRTTLATVDGEVRSVSSSARGNMAQLTAQLQQSMDSVQQLSASLEQEMTATGAAVRVTLQQANTTLEGTSALLDPRGRTVMQMQRAADDLAVTAARLRNLAERVDRDPSILIRGN